MDLLIINFIKIFLCIGKCPTSRKTQVFSYVLVGSSHCCFFSLWLKYSLLKRWSDWKTVWNQLWWFLLSSNCFSLFQFCLNEGVRKMLTWFLWLRSSAQTPHRSIQSLYKQKFLFWWTNFPLPCSRASSVLFNLSPTTWFFFAFVLGVRLDKLLTSSFYLCFFKFLCLVFPLAKLFPSFSLFAFGQYRFWFSAVFRSKLSHWKCSYWLLLLLSLFPYINTLPAKRTEP